VNATGPRDPLTGRVNVLFIGERSGVTPYTMLESDPLMDPYPVIASPTHYSLDIARRSIRLYMPRSFEILSSYQVVILSDSNAAIFSSKHLAWISDAVEVEGSGLAMVGGFEAFGGMAGNANWGETSVGDVLPVECMPGLYFWGKVVILEPEHPFVSSLPLEPGLPWMRLYDGNMLELREGAVELARQVQGDNNPFWSTWEYGSGRSFAISGGWHPAGGLVFMRWEYYGDFANNLMLYLSGNELPEDPLTVHRTRKMFHEYKSSKAYLFAMMDFCEKFGARMNQVVEIVNEADLSFSDATRSYMDQDYEISLGLLEDSLQVLVTGSERAFQLKDRAMIWIYVIEWAVVTSTFAICGVVAWTLMVGRRYYREIGSTRFMG
jgi:uncharacterized membrane protein